MLDLNLELRGDYSDPRRKGAYDRLADESSWYCHNFALAEEELEEDATSIPEMLGPPYDAEQNARQAWERAKFVDFLAMLSKLKVAIGES